MDIWKHTNFIEKFESPDAVFPDEVEQDDPLILYTSVPSAVYIMPYFYFLSFFFLFGVSLFKMVPKYSTKVLSSVPKKLVVHLTEKIHV